MSSRRGFLSGSGASALALALARPVNSAAAPAALHAPHPTHAKHPRAEPPAPYRPVHTLNGWSLPAHFNQGVKEFHLVAESLVQEVAPGMSARLWGYNGSSPGPTLEVVEGDRVRVFVSNHLPEHTSVHWHGMRLSNGMDGVSGLTQAAIQPGQTFVYEFSANRAGSFMYHPHADEMTQLAMGMMGLLIVHPKNPRQHAVDRDFAWLLSTYDIDPGSRVPRTNTMLEFNLWTFNSRVFPGIEPLVVRQGDRVRLRIGNLSMTNHPIHLHGHSMEVTGTDGGWVPPSARWPEVTVDIGVGQMRVLEFVADSPGDWALHCHKSHHTMNAMGHRVPNLIGVDHSGVAEAIQNLIPSYMVMGDKGGAMGDMAMPLPENTLPMMTGQGPFGPLEMGGMFTVLKVRPELAPDDYRDPGWHTHPSGTQAQAWSGPRPELQRRAASAPAPASSPPPMQMQRDHGHTRGHSNPTPDPAPRHPHSHPE